MAKAINTVGTVLYVSNRAKSTFDSVPEEILDGFKKTFVDLKISNENTKIYFIDYKSLEEKLVGLQPELIVFDNCEPRVADFGLSMTKGSKVIVLCSSEFVQYRETWFKTHKNPYLL